MTDVRCGPLKLSKRADTGSWQICGSYGGRYYRVGVGRDILHAKKRLMEFYFDLEAGWRPGATPQDDWEKVAVRVHARHKANAKYRGIPFDITPAMVHSLMKAGGYRCSISGIAYSKRAPGKGDQLSLRDPWAPSIDRIDNQMGYVRDNIRIVCVAANMAMNAWGYDTLLRLANGVVRNSLVAAIPDTSVTNLDTACAQPLEE